MAKSWNSGDQVLASDLNLMVVPCGAVLPFAAPTIPANWLLCDGSAVSRATYSDLFAALVPSLGTFTMTIASPSVFTLNSHGLVAGDAVYLTTTGALPTGFAANTLYYVIATGLTTNAFELSATRGGSAINGSGSQSGTHTVRKCPYGLGDGSTTFNVPDITQKVIVGFKSGDADMGYLGAVGGEKTHVLITGEIPSHTHTLPQNGGGSAGTVVAGQSTNTGNLWTTSATGGDGAHNNLQPFMTMRFIVRY